MEKKTKMTKSEARKAYWANIPKEERKARASKTAKAKWDRTTQAERTAHAKMMIGARNGKEYK